MPNNFQTLIEQYSPNKKPILPVIVINSPETAVPLAKALVDGGIRFLEITLRTEHGLDAIRTLRKEVPSACIGAGTVTTPRQFDQCLEAGAEFIISPGLTARMAQHAHSNSTCYLPGIANASDLMLAQEYGLKELKFFPAEQAGGVSMLKALGAPFPDIHFCPTGGINGSNAQQYLELVNVVAVGGSWMCPSELVQTQNWSEITRLCQQAIN
jgi:2-dehydro-3-deoxyphosphogluconate aldolase/(4S)-4-hydroxy-2-oxoglutarate aldolase